jgi:hypothetical protein
MLACARFTARNEEYEDGGSKPRNKRLRNHERESISTGVRMMRDNVAHRPCFFHCAKTVSELISLPWAGSDVQIGSLKRLKPATRRRFPSSLVAAGETWGSLSAMPYNIVCSPSTPATSGPKLSRASRI